VQASSIHRACFVRQQDRPQEQRVGSSWESGGKEQSIPLHPQTFLLIARARAQVPGARGWVGFVERSPLWKERRFAPMLVE